MSNPTASRRGPPSIDPKLGLMFTVADLMIPLFATGFVDVPLARQMAVSAIEAYQPESRADFVNVARTIAFSMGSIALLAKSMSPDLSMPEQLRGFGRANALSRSADQSERTMMLRRHYHQAHALAESAGSWPENEPGTETSDAEMQAVVVAAVAEYRAACASAGTGQTATETMSAPPFTTPASTTTPSTTTASTAPKAATTPAVPAAGSCQPPATPEPAANPPTVTLAAAIPMAQTPPATTPPAAIRYSDPSADAGQFRTAPYKAGLLQHSAIQRVVEQNGTHHPR